MKYMELADGESFMDSFGDTYVKADESYAQSDDTGMYTMFDCDEQVQRPN